MAEMKIIDNQTLWSSVMSVFNKALTDLFGCTSYPQLVDGNSCKHVKRGAFRKDDKKGTCYSCC
eukprot:4718126-Ditylum_brightwellii.AAC.1